jgi:autotransporter-associated beta strand protein
MNASTRNRWRNLYATAAAISAVTVLGAFQAPAAVKTWNGAGDGVTMSSGANWVGGVAPVHMDALVFDGTTGLNPNNDFATSASFAFTNVTFNPSAGAFTISGNAIFLGGGITNNSTNLQYFAAVVEHNGAARGYHAEAGSMKFDTVNGRANGNVLIKSGTNDLTLAGSVDNNGLVVVVSNGTLIATKTVPRAIGGTTASTVYSNATLRLSPSTTTDLIFARVRLNMQGGTFQLQNTLEGIANLAGWTNSVNAIVENGLAGTTNTLLLGEENNHRSIYNGTIRDGAAGVLNLRIARNTVQQFHGTHTYTGTTTVDNSNIAGTSRLIMNGTHVGGGAYSIFGHPTTVDQFATLHGNGLIAASAINLGIRGVISPGGNWSLDGDGGAYSETAAVLTFSNAVVSLGDVTSTLDVQLNGTNAGSSYDQVAIEGNGSLTNTGANLKLTLGAGFSPAVGDKFTIVKVQGTSSSANDGVFGTLNTVVTDLSQGAVFVEPSSGKNFKISYRAEGTTFDAGAGNGNDIMLQVVAPDGGANLTWRGNGLNNNWDNGTTADWWNGASLVAFNNGDFATFDDTGSNNFPVNLTGDLAAPTISVNAIKDYVFGGSGTFTNAVVLTKTNSGTLSIVNDTINLGSTIIQRGTVQIGTNGTTGNLSGNVSVNQNGVLAFNHSDDKVINTAAFNGMGAFVHNGSGKLNITADLSSSFTGRTTNSGGVLEFGDGTGTVGQIAGEVWVQGTNAVRYNFSGANADIKNSLAGAGTVEYENVTAGTIHIALTAVSSNFTGTNVIGALTRVHGQTGNSGYPFGNGSTVIVPDGSQAWCDTSATTYNNTFHIAGNGWPGVTRPTGAISVFNCTFNGLINMTTNARISGTIAGGTILCPITGSHQLEIWGNAGSYVLNMGPTNGVHSYASTLITEGTVRALNTSAISTGPLTIDVAADLRLNGNNLAVASLTSTNSGSVTGPGAIVQNTHASTAAALTVGGDNSSAGFDGYFLDGGAGSLGLTKVGSGTFTVTGINSNSGPVIVNGGTLALSGSGSFGFASQIIANATLDVTGAGGVLTLNSGQTLKGSGNVIGEVIASAGSTVAPGSSVGTLTVSGNVTLGGQLHMELNRTNAPFNCDRLVSSGGTITYGGSLLITNIGPVLQVNDTFQVFPSGVGAFGAVTVATTDASGNIYTWQNDIASLGSVKVLSVTAPVNTTPTNIVASVSGGNLNLSWPSDHTGWSLQTQTNVLGVGLNTNWVTVAGSTTTNAVSIPISPANPAVFFRLQYP